MNNRFIRYFCQFGMKPYRATFLHLPPFLSQVVNIELLRKSPLYSCKVTNSPVVKWETQYSPGYINALLITLYSEYMLYNHFLTPQRGLSIFNTNARPAFCGKPDRMAEWVECLSSDLWDWRIRTLWGESNQWLKNGYLSLTSLALGITRIGKELWNEEDQPFMTEISTA